MRFIDKLKEWWNQPSCENEVCEGYNQIAMKLAQEMKEQKEAKQKKLKSYERMSERELLIEIAKNTLRDVE